MIPSSDFLLGFAGGLLAFANGANDNFKPVATLCGSGETSYRRALLWATIATVAGSVASLAAAEGLRDLFAGKGLVGPETAGRPAFREAAVFGAALTVPAATRLGLPVSTTHALAGGLMGAGLAASPSTIALNHLGSALFLPLAATPLIAASGTALLRPAARKLAAASGITSSSRLCAGTLYEIVPGLKGAAAFAAARLEPRRRSRASPWRWLSGAFFGPGGLHGASPSGSSKSPAGRASQRTS